ncbi:MAG: hypothetical protein M3Y27_31610 [Acidobacteriota bacterium]|nr:hypothetical protein [Acidobacteriota bacterium]
MAEVNGEKKRHEERERKSRKVWNGGRFQGLARRNEFFPSSFWRSPSAIRNS